MLKIVVLMMAQAVIQPLPALEGYDTCGTTPPVDVSDIPEYHCWGGSGGSAGATDGTYNSDSAKLDKVVMTIQPDGQSVEILGRIYTPVNLLAYLSNGAKLEKSDPVVIRTSQASSGSVLNDLSGYLRNAGYSNITVLILEDVMR